MKRIPFTPQKDFLARLSNAGSVQAVPEMLFGKIPNSSLKIELANSERHAKYEQLSTFSMSIPAFDHNLVLPPHIGDPRNASDLSPYRCSTVDLVQRFATTDARKEILRKFLEFRQLLQSHGLEVGYQWLDGSFLEDIETLESRPPGDMDLLTIFWGYPLSFLNELVTKFPAFLRPEISKRDFQLDHFPIMADEAPQATVENTRYWIQLFTHRRDGVWKGMLRIELNTPADDSTAMDYLNQT